MSSFQRKALGYFPFPHMFSISLSFNICSKPLGHTETQLMNPYCLDFILLLVLKFEYYISCPVFLEGQSPT